MTNLSNLLDEATILDPLPADNRQKALRALSDLLSRNNDLDPYAVFEAICERERLGSTGVGDGVAIPHARIDGLSEPVGAFARLTRPCDFEALDERPCDLIFMLLAPARQGGDHLRALAQVARTFRDASLRAALREGQHGAATLLLGNTEDAAA